MTEQQIALRVLEARAQIADHLLDGAVYIALAFSLFGLLQVEAGLTLRSFVAFGSAGTLIFSLASKDLATQLVNGLALSASDKVYEGEQVILGNNISGVIQKMSWTETKIRNPDETVTIKPNSMLSNQKITNLSRVSKSNVKQTLRFHYEHDQFDIRIGLIYPIYLMPFNIFQPHRLDHDTSDVFHHHLQSPHQKFHKSKYIKTRL